MPVVTFTDFTFPSLKVKNGLFMQFEPIQVDAISEMRRAKVIIKGESVCTQRYPDYPHLTGTGHY